MVSDDLPNPVEGIATSCACGSLRATRSGAPSLPRWADVDFNRKLPLTELRSTVRVERGERGIWQRRYWEHWIRDEADFRAHMHMDYVHINPVKHGLVKRVAEWPYSTFHPKFRSWLKGIPASH